MTGDTRETGSPRSVGPPMKAHWVIQRVLDRTLWTGNRWVHDPIAAKWFESADDARRAGLRDLKGAGEWTVIEIHGTAA